MYTEKTYTPKEAEVDKKWHIVDADGLVVGRLATQIANVLRGKNKPQFTPNADMGDFVVVVNCEKVKFTGNKWDDKIYYRHTNHVGGLKQRTAKEQLEKHPEQILYLAVKRMLPKGSLAKKQLTKLKLFVGPNHDHEAQKPEELKFN
jgi:large subunit ribosomal protein L13